MTESLKEDMTLTLKKKLFFLSLYRSQKSNKSQHFFIFTLFKVTTLLFSNYSQLVDTQPSSKPVMQKFVHITTRLYKHKM